ncbi:MAG: c-type cytochrome [Nitrospirae bacterium]|nr:c-type cytochrome [Nitrospirota bacterium]
MRKNRVKTFKGWTFGFLAMSVCAGVLLAGCGSETADVDLTTASVANGGLLYDKWWKVSKLTTTEPTDTHALYPADGKQKGADTWRCKECHGWDYKGKDGAYAKGSHFTGITGINAAAAKGASKVYDALRGKPNASHNFATVLSDAEVKDLTRFVLEGLYDSGGVVGSDKKATGGDATQGKTVYTTTMSCNNCHGDDGMKIEFHDEEYLGDLALDNPWEFLHKARFGNPGSTMPGTVPQSVSNDVLPNLLAYSQSLGAAWASASLKTGGLIYDKWWKVSKKTTTEPTGNHALYPSTGKQSGADTWRCKECHGWDYKGKDGAYSKGSHLTGIAGIIGAKDKTRVQIGDALKGVSVAGHTFSSLLSDEELASVTKFIKTGIIDMATYVDSSTKAGKGDSSNGKTLFDGKAQCSSCHGTDGKKMNLAHEPPEEEYIGDMANDNPWETLHKIRIGHPGATMPSGLQDNGLTDKETGDVLTYAQSLK